MRIVIFCHSLLSDWNHGNAHFLRGMVRAMQLDGHDVRVYEPADAWSLQNLLEGHGEEPLRQFASHYPTLSSTRYDEATTDLDVTLDGANLVLVHEWNEPSLVQRIGEHRKHSDGYQLLFHDTHHRSVTDQDAMSRYDLSGYDGVLAFGASVAEVYRKHGWGRRVWVWHEAADPEIFRPIDSAKEGDLVWVGNWGDDERTAELQEFLIDPVADLRLKARIHGVRYPADAVARLERAGIDYAGWAANFNAPRIFSRYRVTVHVPRRPYATALPGVPTIRIFEALSCGIPLVSAPWSDSEHLFNAGRDFLFARNGAEMKQHLRAILNEPDTAAALARHGRTTILERHTCAHRLKELYGILDEIGTPESMLAGGAAN
jgi:spore maturation protein CgeB